MGTPTSAATSTRAGRWSSTSLTIVEVELDVFSGRLNPRWTLDPVVGELLAALLPSLTSRVDRLAPGDRELPGLGYRGFVVRAEGRVWRVWRGLLISDSEFATDSARSVEALLLAALPQEYSSLKERIQAEIARSPQDPD